jgi:hypothetical protein
MVNRVEFDSLKDHVHQLDKTLVEVEAKASARDVKIDRIDSKMDKLVDLLNTILGSMQVGSTHTKKLLEGV